MAEEQALNRAARGHQEHRLTPINDGEHFVRGRRWPERGRVLLVSGLVSHLTPAERMRITKGGDFPSDHTRMSKAYWQLQHEMHNLIGAEDAERGVITNPMPSREAIVKAARQWTRVFLQEGSVHDAPPHVPGYLVRRNAEALTAIKDMLLAGYQQGGQQHLYRSLKDLSTRQPIFFEYWRSMTGLRSLPALWNQLTQAFPDVSVMELRVKRVRDSSNVQV